MYYIFQYSETYQYRSTISGPKNEALIYYMEVVSLRRSQSIVQALLVHNYNQVIFVERWSLDAGGF